MTESAGSIFRTVGQEECAQWGSTGKMNAGGYEAKFVDPDTGEALPPCREGELWIRGPTIMKGKLRAIPIAHPPHYHQIKSYI